MIELWLIPLIGILGIVSTIISSKGSLFDKRYKWFKRLTTRGQIIAIIGLVIVALSVWQYISVKNKEREKDNLQIVQQKMSDSIVASEIKKGIDSNRQQLFNDLSEAFAKQNLKIDTITDKIKILRDSAKTVFVSAPSESPIIVVRGDGVKHIIKKDTVQLEISLVSIQAPAKLASVDYFCELNFTDGSKSHTKKFNLITGTILLPKNERLSKSFDLYTNKPLASVFIALIGKYASTDNHKVIILKDLYQYSFSTKETGFYSGDDKRVFFEKYKN